MLLTTIPLSTPSSCIILPRHTSWRPNPPSGVIISSLYDGDTVTTLSASSIPPFKSLICRSWNKVSKKAPSGSPRSRGSGTPKFPVQAQCEQVIVRVRVKCARSHLLVCLHVHTSQYPVLCMHDTFGVSPLHAADIYMLFQLHVPQYPMLWMSNMVRAFL